MVFKDFLLGGYQSSVLIKSWAAGLGAAALLLLCT